MCQLPLQLAITLPACALLQFVVYAAVAVIVLLLVLVIYHFYVHVNGSPLLLLLPPHMLPEHCSDRTSAVLGTRSMYFYFDVRVGYRRRCRMASPTPRAVHHGWGTPW